MNNNESMIKKNTNKQKDTYSQRKEFLETQKMENINNDADKKKLTNYMGNALCCNKA